MESVPENVDFFVDVKDINKIEQDNKQKINIINNLNEKIENKEENNSEEVSLDNIDEDLYMQELYIKLSQMKQDRKKAEDNAKLLDNRLNLLKG